MSEASPITLREGDNRTSLQAMIDRGEQVDSVVTDPPYGLVSIQKRFGKASAKAARTDRNDGSFNRLSKGFMGKAWDGSGIERDPEFWALVYDVLKPGGYVFAFSGSRTSHWQAVAMEQAGFVIHPLHAWLFGSGFPKAHAADKAIDKMLGIEGTKVATGAPVKRMVPGAEQNSTGSWVKDGGRTYQPGEYIAGSPEGAEWSGWAYGTQAQKPALEPIILAQKPFSEKTGAANILKHGVGAVNIEGCRVPTEGRVQIVADYKDTNNATYGGRMDGSLKGGSKAAGSTTKGRHPANLIHDGSEDVLALFPDSKGQIAKASTREDARKTQNTYGQMKTGSGGHEPRGDTGSAARFFNCFPPDCPIAFYHPKAGKKDRAGSKHPTVKPIALMQHLIRHVTPPGGTVLDPFAGSGTTAEAARLEGMACILMEAEPDYTAFLKQRFNLDHAPEGDVAEIDVLLGLEPTNVNREVKEFHDLDEMFT